MSQKTPEELELVLLHAETLYFDIIEHLNIYPDCVEPDPDVKNGTRNTDYGAELYQIIESSLLGEDNE